MLCLISVRIFGKSVDSAIISSVTLMNRRENLLSEISIVCTAVYISLLPSNEVPVKQTYAVNTSSLKF